MTRQSLNFAVDWFAYALLTALVGTGLLLHFRLPPGSGAASLLSMTRHEWGEVHFWIAVGLSAAVLVHLLLHASWIKAMTLGNAKGAIRSRRAWLGIMAAGLLLAVAASAMFWPVTSASDGGRRTEFAGGAEPTEHEGNHKAGREVGGRGGGHQRGRAQ